MKKETDLSWVRASILILENLDHAIKRDANILCELTGYGMSSDAYHYYLNHQEMALIEQCTIALKMLE